MRCLPNSKVRGRQVLSLADTHCAGVVLMAAGFILTIYKNILQVSMMSVTKLAALASVLILYNMTIEQHKTINIKSQQTDDCFVSMKVINGFVFL